MIEKVVWPNQACRADFSFCPVFGKCTFHVMRRWPLKTLTEIEIIQMRNEYAKGAKYEYLAAKYKISHGAVWYWIRKPILSGFSPLSFIKNLDQLAKRLK